MKKLISLFFIMIICSCDLVKNENNIRIKNADLKNRILQFNEDAKYYTGSNTDNTVSVAFWKDNNEIPVGFYSSKKLRDQDYLGKTNVDKLKVYFYSNDKSTYNDLIAIKYNAKGSKNTKDPSHTYTCYYVFKNQKLELISPSNSSNEK